MWTTVDPWVLSITILDHCRIEEWKSGGVENYPSLKQSFARETMSQTKSLGFWPFYPRVNRSEPVARRLFVVQIRAIVPRLADFET